MIIIVFMIKNITNQIIITSNKKLCVTFSRIFMLTITTNYTLIYFYPYAEVDRLRNNQKMQQQLNKTKQGNNSPCGRPCKYSHQLSRKLAASHFLRHQQSTSSQRDLSTHDHTTRDISLTYNCSAVRYFLRMDMTAQM